MKKLIISSIIFFPLLLTAQIERIFLDDIKKKEYKHELNFDFTYNYNQTSSSQLFADIIYKNYIAKWVDLTVGLHTQTNSTYALLAKTNFKWNIKSHHNLELRNQYLYNIFAPLNSQSFNALLAAAYSQKYCYIALGIHTQFFAPIIANNNPEIIYEPIHFAYNLKCRIFPIEHNWNLALQVTNITPFLIERAYSPNFIMQGQAKIIESNSERIDITFKIGLEPAGIFNVIAQQYELFVSAGIKCKI